MNGRKEGRALGGVEAEVEAGVVWWRGDYWARK
jgi:hypothetical protein